MAFDPGLAVGETITNEQLRAIFKCGGQGGMRRSHRTGTLVLTTSVSKGGPYRDRWIDGVLHYTGMGLDGDQSLSFAQNKTLDETPANGVEVFLFEVEGSNQYRFMGQVERDGSPYDETQDGAAGDPRRVWVFPLRLVDQPAPAPISEAEWNRRQRQLEEALRRLGAADLLKRASKAPRVPGSRPVTSTQFERDPAVKLYTLRRADGRCELCKRIAPFEKKNGDPYLETHHIDLLSKGGDDSIDNTVALCPNCHRKVHSLGLRADIDALKALRAEPAGN